MKTITSIACVSMLIAGATFLTSSAVLAQGQKLTVDQVMEKCIAASGGRAAYNKIKSAVVKGEIEVKPQGLKGTFTESMKAPGMMAMAQKISGIGDMRQGFDGNVGWSQDPFTGLRELSGAELATFKRDAAFNPQLRWKELYKSAEMLGVKQVDGKSVYAIKLTPAVGKPVTQYFDTKTFLMAGMDAVQEGPQGTVAVHMSMSDYHTVDGVKEPFLLQQKLGPAEIVMKITEVKNNVPIDAALFAKPAEGVKK